MKRTRPDSLLWLCDTLGAGVFAWGLATAIAALVAGQGAQPVEDASFFNSVADGALWMLAGGLIRAVAVYAARYAAARTAQKTVAPARSALLRRFFGGAMAEPLRVGESAALSIDYIDHIEGFEAQFVPIRFAAIAGPATVALLVSFASPIAALIMLGTLLPFGLGMIMAGGMARRASDAQLLALSHLSDLFADRLRNLPMIRHFNAGERLTRQVAGATDDLAKRTMAVLRIAFISTGVMEFFAALAVAMVALYCGFSLLGILPFPVPEKLSFRDALFALALAPEFYLPMRRLAAAYHEKQLGEAAQTAIAPYVVEDPPQQAAIPPFAGVTLGGVMCQWPGRSIGPVSFTMGATGLTAITGPTGSGKTSMLAIIAGQLLPAAGAVTAIAPEAIAWAAQRPLILPGTLRDNLRLVRPDVDDDAVLHACADVGLDTLLATRAEGLDLMLDHRASGLSGGELRRLALARAILSDRPLILCDEPTADLDADSAAAVTGLLRHLAARHAVIVATHDAALAAVADQQVTV